MSTSTVPPASRRAARAPCLATRCAMLATPAYAADGRREPQHRSLTSSLTAGRPPTSFTVQPSTTREQRSIMRSSSGITRDPARRLTQTAVRIASALPPQRARPARARRGASCVHRPTPDGFDGRHEVAASEPSRCGSPSSAPSGRADAHRSPSTEGDHVSAATTPRSPSTGRRRRPRRRARDAARPPAPPTPASAILRRRPGRHRHAPAARTSARRLGGIPTVPVRGGRRAHGRRRRDPLAAVPPRQRRRRRSARRVRPVRQPGLPDRAVQRHRPCSPPPVRAPADRAAPTDPTTPLPRCGRRPRCRTRCWPGRPAADAAPVPSPLGDRPHRTNARSLKGPVAEATFGALLLWPRLRGYRLAPDRCGLGRSGVLASAVAPAGRRSACAC